VGEFIFLIIVGVAKAGGAGQLADRRRRSDKDMPAVAGAGAAGCPTSMWIILAPCASRSAAAAMTSMTMNGGTSLRFDGANSLFAASSIVFGRLGLVFLPRCRRNPRFACDQRRHDRVVIAGCVDRLQGRQ